MLLIFAEADIHPVVWGMIPAVITALGGWLLSVWKQKDATDKSRREDAIKEWIELHKNDKARIEQLTIDIGRLNCQMNDLQDEHLECRQRCAELDARIIVLESALVAAGKEVPKLTTPIPKVREVRG